MPMPLAKAWQLPQLTPPGAQWGRAAWGKTQRASQGCDR